MPKYKIELISTRYYMTDFEVTADNEEAAEELAYEIAIGDADHPDKPKGWEPDWEWQDGEGVQVYKTEEVT